MSKTELTDDEQLLNAARSARARAYAPYSKFLVGAAVLSQKGQIFSGCNVENASYGATLCAERVAITKMVSEGEMVPVAIAIYTEADELTMPCGMCRQVLAEFAPALRVIVGGPSRSIETSLDKLFPRPFTFSKEP